MFKPDSVVVLSGGLDSVTLLHYVTKTLNKEPLALSFNYGQRHIIELQYAKMQAQALSLQHLIVDLTSLSSAFSRVSTLMERSEQGDVPNVQEVLGDPQPTTYVPNRNMIMASIAAAFAESYGVEEIYLGIQKHDIYGYWDTTKDFMERVNNVLKLNRKNMVKFEGPFVSYSKAEVLKIGWDLGIDYAQTWSCYEGASATDYMMGIQRACGKCPTCAERLAAFAANGLVDPLLYKES